MQIFANQPSAAVAHFLPPRTLDSVESLNQRDGNGAAPLERPTATLSVVLSTFNEETNLRRAVDEARSILPKVARTWEIILVNDGGEDSTTSLCDELAAQYHEVRAIHHAGNRGYGAALKSGTLAARYDFIFFTDCDGQFDLEELSQLTQWSGHYDIVTGYRAKRQDPPHRLINARGWNLLVRLLLGVKVRDIDCAFKIFHRSVFDRVQIRSVGAMVNTEILAQANAFGMRIHEVKVSHYPRHFGKPTGARARVTVRAFGELFGLYRRLGSVTKEQPGLYRAAASSAPAGLRRQGIAEKIGGGVGAVSYRFTIDPVID